RCSAAETPRLALEVTERAESGCRVGNAYLRLLAGMEPLGRVENPYSFGCRSFDLSSGWLREAETHPLHSTTGKAGYFEKRVSMSDNLHRTKVEPRSERIVLACVHVEHRPGATRETTAPV